MKRFFTAVLLSCLSVVTACSHGETKLADELASENIGQSELVNTAPSQEVVATEPLNTPAVAPAYEVSAPAPTKHFTKKVAKRKVKKSRKMLAKAKRRGKRASHR